jgi:hypothetical protein
MASLLLEAWGAFGMHARHAVARQSLTLADAPTDGQCSVPVCGGQTMLNGRCAAAALIQHLAHV